MKVSFMCPTHDEWVTRVYNSKLGTIFLQNFETVLYYLPAPILLLNSNTFRVTFFSLSLKFFGIILPYFFFFSFSFCSVCLEVLFLKFLSFLSCLSSVLSFILLYPSLFFYIL